MEPLLVGLFLAIAFVLGILVGWHARKDFSITSPSDSSPRVVVNVPADYKALESLMVDGKPALVGPRALLYWTIWKAANDDGDFQSPGACASKAVRDVYGDTFDT